MKILQRYILSFTLRNLALCLMVFTMLFLIIDFFDRIDNIIGEDVSLFTTLQYFLYRIPLMFSLMLPVAMLVATVLTLGLLSKNSEITAMRAAGLKLFWIARPLFITGLALSFVALLVNETVVPWSMRRVKEIYNIDIKRKDKRGGYSQENFWWRTGQQFYSVGIFDSRNSTLYGFSKLDLSADFEVRNRTDAEYVKWIDPLLGWNMRKVQEYDFQSSAKSATPITGNVAPGVKIKNFAELPLPVSEKPEDFYDTRTDPQTMSFRQLRKFIKEQRRNGLRVSEYMADLYAKLAFPFSIFFVVLAVLPFSLKTARSGSMAVGLLAGLAIGFGYFSLHSFSIAIGRAELWPPLLAAWMANIVLAALGVVLSLGAEAP